MEIIPSVPLKKLKKLSSVDINSKLHDDFKSFLVKQFMNKYSVLNSSDDIQLKQPRSIHDEPDTQSLSPSNDDILFYDEKGDFLFAKALASNEKESIYKKHIGVEREKE